MHEETKREVIDEFTSMLGTFAKEMVIYRAEMNTMEKRHEHELELERTRQQHVQRGDHGDGGQGGAGEGQHREPMHVESQVTDAPESDAGGGGGVVAGPHPDFDRVLDRLEQQDQCSFCRDLLRAIREQPPDVQAEALAEYGRLKGAMETGASQDELERVIEDSDTIQRLLEDKVSGR